MSSSRNLPGQARHFHFASDNTSGICPEAFAALLEANEGFLPSYGEDAWTQRAADLIRETFEKDCEVFFVFNGTAANSLALASLCRSYHSVICHREAHVEKDECGAAEFFSNGTKILLGDGRHGKLDTDSIEELVTRRTDIHYPKPRVVSLTQPTELGTVYSPDHLGRISEVARRHGLAVHMDGARFANACASLDLPPRALTWEAGVDVLCLGGTKNGLAVGEAVVFFDRALAAEFDYRCKQAGQLCSKMRFLAAPWVGMLAEGAWLRHARHANTSARRLADGLAALPGVKILCPVEANAVFAQLPPALADGLGENGWHVYNFIGESGYRFMCSWKTTPEDIDTLLKACRETLAAAG
ncbi:MAG: low specificity L-threonine aldolase [Puniceicoccaceae bacterium]|nr:MAG: low specificity L-threonine aldolase [Puniceicoccaceae bacterium]